MKVGYICDNCNKQLIRGCLTVSSVAKKSVKTACLVGRLVKSVLKEKQKKNFKNDLMIYETTL